MSKILDSNLEEKRFCTEWYQAFPDLNLLLISSEIEFILLKFFPNILKLPPFRRYYFQYVSPPTLIPSTYCPIMFTSTNFPLYVNEPKIFGAIIETSLPEIWTYDDSNRSRKMVQSGWRDKIQPPQILLNTLCKYLWITFFRPINRDCLLAHCRPYPHVCTANWKYSVRSFLKSVLSTENWIQLLLCYTAYLWIKMKKTYFLKIFLFLFLTWLLKIILWKVKENIQERKILGSFHA